MNLWMRTFKSSTRDSCKPSIVPFFARASGACANGRAGRITASFQNLVAWSWVKDQERYLIVVNLSDSSVQSRVQVRWTGRRWR